MKTWLVVAIFADNGTLIGQRSFEIQAASAVDAVKKLWEMLPQFDSAHHALHSRSIVKITINEPAADTAA